MPLVAVSHYPEGAGHATRMLAVARALERRGARVRMAGGGPGERFAALNGYDEFVPRRVDYIGDYQRGSLRRVVRNSLPASADRVTDYVRWLREIDPAAMVTDDMFAAVAAPLAGVPLYVLTHNAPFLYDGRVERSFTRLWTTYQRRVAREFFYPAAWPAVPGDPRGVVRTPPVALESAPVTDVAATGADGRSPGAPAPDATPGRDAGRAADGGTFEDVGVLVVPSHYSTDPDGLVDRVAGAGHRVTSVADDDWEPVPSLLPAIRAADAVVCSGYSTVMEAAVAGTPCVVTPHTDEQRGVCRVLRANSVTGFRVAQSPEEVVAALADPPAATPRENGAGVAADRILADL